MFVAALSTIVSSIIRDNTARIGGGIHVEYSSSTVSTVSTVNIYGTTFSSNTAGNGPDIYRQSGTVTVYGCAAGGTVRKGML